MSTASQGSNSIKSDEIGSNRFKWGQTENGTPLISRTLHNKSIKNQTIKT